MVDESTRFLAQSRTFEISPKSGDVVEVDFAGLASPVVEAPNTVVDSKYKILELLGQGGMGAVYRAQHLMLNKDIAFKTFSSSRPSAEAIGRFEREVRAVAKLDSANVVRVFDFGITEKNQPYYTMELLIGQTLEQKLDTSGALPVDKALAIFTDVAEGLKSAHNKGIIHRDLKPGNIFLSTQPNNRCVAKIVDFGIAKLADNSRATQNLTSVGLVFGSPLYMSPEQGCAAEVDKRSDIYSFGCALYETLTGQPPLIGSNAVETMTLHQTKTPARLSKRAPDKTFPAMLESFVGRLLLKDPDKRPQSFEEVLAAFERIRSVAQAESVSPNRSIDEDTTFATSKTANTAIIITASALLIVGLGLAGIFVIAGHLQKSIEIKAETKPPVELSNEAPDPLLTQVDQPTEILTQRPSRFRLAPRVNSVVIHTTELIPINFDDLSKSSVTKLELMRCKFDNVELHKLSSLKLRTLNLRLSNLNDRGAQALTNCKWLVSLQVDGTQITDNACVAFAGISTLESLDVSRTGITDRSLHLLAQLPRLRELRLDNTSVTIDGITKLCEQSPSLQYLYVSGCPKLEMDQIRQLQSRFHNIQIKTEDSPLDRDNQRDAVDAGRSLR